MNVSGLDVRVALVGAGFMAREHVRAFSGLAAVVGVASRDINRARRFGDELNIPFTTSSVPDLLRRVEPDLVVIAVPELELPSVIESCLDSGVTVLAEKPIGIDLGVSTALTRLVRDHSLRAFVALNRRHYSSTRTTLKGLSDQENSMRLIQVLDQEDPVAARAAGQPDQVVRNWMFANSIHVVDLITLFGRGKVVSVEVFDAWNPCEPGFVSGAIRFESGDRAIYQAVWDAPGPWSCVVTTPEKRYEMRPLEKLSVQDRGSRLPVDVPLHPVDQDFKPGLRRQAEESIRAVKGLSHRLPSFEDSLVSMGLVADLYGLRGC